MNRIILFFSISLVVFACNKNSEPKPDHSGLFVKFFGGAFDDEGFSVASGNDGSFYLAGSTITQDKDTTALVVKIDQYGNKVWEKHYKLENSTHTEARDIMVDDDGNLLVTGFYYTSTGGFSDMFILKIDRNNASIINSNFKYGEPLKNEKSYRIIKGDNGSIVIYGSIDTLQKLTPATSRTVDMYVIKVNSTLSSSTDTIWTKPWGLFGRNDEIGSIKRIETPGHTFQNYFLWCGTANREGESNMRLVLSNEFGNLRWDRGYGELNQLDEAGKDFDFIEGRGYIIAGSKANNSRTTKEIYLARTNVNGSVVNPTTDNMIIKIKGDGISDAFAQEATSVISLNNGEYIITGYVTSDKLDKNIFVAKVNEAGTVVDYNTFGGPVNDVGNKILRTADNGFIIIGTVNEDAGKNKMVGVYKVNDQLELIP